MKVKMYTLDIGHDKFLKPAGRKLVDETFKVLGRPPGLFFGLFYKERMDAYEKRFLALLKKHEETMIVHYFSGNITVENNEVDYDVLMRAWKEGTPVHINFADSPYSGRVYIGEFEQGFESTMFYYGGTGPLEKKEIEEGDE